MSIDWIEGATHYHENTRCFYKKVEGVWNLMSDGMDHGRSSSLYNGEISEYDLIERPKQPQAWSGPEDGLPPVGTVCEVDHGNGKHWDKVTIVAHHREKAIYLDPVREIHYIWGLVKDFRSIRTQEQIFAEKRETAIADMAKVLPGAKSECYTFNADGSVRPYSHIREVLELLVDAGFKREGV